MIPIRINDLLIRRVEPRDEEGAYRVCLATGDDGREAGHLFTDPKALGHIYVGPYLHLEPDLAFVGEDPLGICGYVLGALDSKQFYDHYKNLWLPEIRARHPAPTGDRARWSLTERIYHEYHHPEIFWPEPYDLYPSHLHIDLLPRVQGRGLGRRMMEVLLRELALRVSPGVHLGMAESNVRAERFYRRLGFQELTRVAGVLYLGKQLATGA